MGRGGESDGLAVPPCCSLRQVLSGAKALSAAVWSPGGDRFVVQCDGSLVVCAVETMETVRWLRLPGGESFTGRPVG